MQNYEKNLGPRPEGSSEKEKGYLIPADDLAAAGLLCAHCRGDLGHFIDDGRIILEVRDDETPGVDEGEIWDTLREYMPDGLCALLEDDGYHPQMLWNYYKEEGWLEK